MNDEDKEIISQLIGTPAWIILRRYIQEKQDSLLKKEYEIGAGVNSIAIDAVSRQRTVEMLNEVLRDMESSTKYGKKEKTKLM
jgi:hypothetical protein